MQPSITEIERGFMSIAQIAEDSGQDVTTVHNWLNYHRFMKKVYLLDRPAVSRSDYEKFKQEHPELIKTSAATQ